MDSLGLVFRVGEYDVDIDCIEDASRLVFTCCLDDIQACFAQMPSCQCAFERLVLHHQDKRGRPSRRTFRSNRLRQHGDPFPHQSPIEDDDVIVVSYMIRRHQRAASRKLGPQFPGPTGRSVMPRGSPRLLDQRDAEGLPLVSSQAILTKC